MVHQPVSRGFAVFTDAWLSGWLAEISADLRENGSALEVVLHDYALYKSTFTLLYFTLLLSVAASSVFSLLYTETNECQFTSSDHACRPQANQFRLQA